MASFKSARERANENHEERKRRFGGGVSDEKQDRKEVAAGVHKHERNMHKGEKETKLATGGKVEGRAAGGGRLDRKGGGKAGKKGTTVNIILGGAGQQQPPQVRPVPVPVRAPMPGAGGPPPGMPPGAMPPRPPVAGMGPGGPPGMPPPGAMPPGGPMMPPRKRGGGVKMTAGAGSGEGRLEKERMVE